MFGKVLFLFTAAIFGADSFAHTEVDEALAPATLLPASEAVALESCTGSDGEEIKREIKRRVLSYNSNLDNASRDPENKDGAERAQARKPEIQALAAYLNRYDASCFTGVAELSKLCTQLQSDRPVVRSGRGRIKGSAGIVQFDEMRMNGFVFQKESGRNTWNILNEKEELLGSAQDRDNDGSVDKLTLFGSIQRTKEESNRSVWGIETSIQENVTEFSKGKQIDLRSSPAYANFLRASTPAARCLGISGHLPNFVSIVAQDLGWSPKDVAVKPGLFDRHTWFAYLNGFGEGAQKGARGSVAGVTNVVVGTAQGAKALYDLSIAGSAFLVTAGPRLATDHKYREKFFNGMAAFAQATVVQGVNLGTLWSGCAATNRNEAIMTAVCFENKIRLHETLAKAKDVVSGLVDSIIAGIKNCWTEEKAEFKDGEYFAECMGQVAGMAAGSAGVGAGAQALRGAAAVSTGIRATALRGGAVLGETLFDPGLAGFVPTKAALTQLKHADKVAESLARKLVSQPGILDRAQAMQIVSQISPARLTDPIDQNDLLGLIGRIQKVHAAPGMDPLDTELLVKTINSWDPVALKGYSEVLEKVNAVRAHRPTMSPSDASKEALKDLDLSPEDRAQAMSCLTSHGRKLASIAQ